MGEEEEIFKIIDELIKADPLNVFIRVKSYLGLLAFRYRDVRDIKEDAEAKKVSVKYFVKCPKRIGGGRLPIDIEVSIMKDILGRSSWVRVTTRLLKFDELSDEKKLSVLKSLLEANYLFPEFSYDIDDKGWIGITEDIFIPALTYDVFMEEFIAIIHAIDHFVKNVVEKYNIKIKCYREKVWDTT